MYKLTKNRNIKWCYGRPTVSCCSDLWEDRNTLWSGIMIGPDQDLLMDYVGDFNNVYVT